MKKIITAAVYSVSGILLLYNVITNTSFIEKQKKEPPTTSSSISSENLPTVESAVTTEPKKGKRLNTPYTNFIEKSYVVSPHRTKLNNEKEVVESNGNTRSIWSNDIQNDNYSTTNEWVIVENITIIAENSGPPPPGPPPPGGSLPINGSVIYLFLMALLLGFFVNYRYSFK